MKTEKQIKKEIKALKTIRPNIIPMSLFGDDNLAGVDAQIAVLENDWDEDDVYDEFDRCAIQESVLESALHAQQWIEDEEDPDCEGLACGWPLHKENQNDQS